MYDVDARRDATAEKISDRRQGSQLAVFAMLIEAIAVASILVGTALTPLSSPPFLLACGCPRLRSTRPRAAPVSLARLSQQPSAWEMHRGDLSTCKATSVRPQGDGRSSSNTA